VGLAGIYTAPLAAAFAPDALDCCATGMCPRPGHAGTHYHSGTRQQTQNKMPDCGMGSQSGATRMCEMGACETKNENVVSFGVFVMSAPMRIIRSTIQVSVSPSAIDLEIPVSQIPDTPPPRISHS
jgi:hypothetical protein